MRLRKYQIKLLLVLGGILLFSAHGQAIERAGMIGQTWSFPVFLDPKTSYHEKTFHFDMSYFLDEKVSAAFAVNVQVGGRKIFYLELGPDFYPFPDFLFQPFVTARLLYAVEPVKDAGWLASMGVECPLGKSYQIQNLKFRISSGMGQFFFDVRNDTFIELVRLGFVWTF